VVAGGDAFPGEVLGYGWSYDDFEDSYSAPTDELLFNEGFSELHIHAGDRPGDPVRVETRPARSFPRVHVNARTIALPTDTAARRRANTLVARKDSSTWEIHVEGNIPVRDSMIVEVTDHDPATSYLAAVREALRDKGIAIDESATDTTAHLETLATLSSPPLSEILKALMKPSQNQIAEVLLRTLGLERAGVGTADSGRRVVERQFAEWKIPSDAFVVRDGSGLSRNDLISPEAVVMVLDVMRRAPSFDLYFASLPIAGVDGTIRMRMRGTPAENNVRAKTGTLSMVRSLSGYVKSADGRLLQFSILCNNWTAPQASVDRVADAIAVQLATMRIR
jgi:D-alanyl-D-alanine carboxypeptidase/D-alanyl-D-alanine-endopeptidase (penicillin-binding protein 4)